MVKSPGELQESLRKAIFEVFSQAWDVLEPGPSGPTAVEEAVLASARDFVAAAARQKYAAVAQAARLQNERASWVNRLPDELWCRPYLWTRLHFCTFQERAGAPNAIGVQHILDLSRNLSLDVTIETSTLQKTFIGIVDALQAQAARIIRLCVRSSHVDAPAFVMRYLRMLPALHEFEVVRLSVPTDSNYMRTFPFCVSAVNMPVLERVRLDVGFVWPRDRCHLASVRELVLTPREFIDLELRRALFGCPNLRTLKVDLQLYVPGSELDPPSASRWPDSVAHLQSVTFVGLSDSDTVDDWVLAFCRGSGWHELALAYYRDCNDSIPIGWTVLDAATTDGSAVEVRVTYSREKVLTVGVTSSKRIRRVTLASCDDPSSYLDDLACILTKARCRATLTVDIAFPNILAELQPTLARMLASEEQISP